MRWFDKISRFIRETTAGKQPTASVGGSSGPIIDNQRIIDTTVQSFFDLKDPRDIDTLIDALDDDEFNVWYHTGRALVKLGASAIPALLENLQGSPRLKRRVIELLGDINDSRAIEPLLLILQGQDQVDVEAAAKALGKMSLRDPNALEPIFNVYHGSKNRIVRTNLDKALLAMGDYAVEPLLDIMNGKDIDLGNKAITLLGRLKSKLSVKPLVDNIYDDKKEIRVNIALALAEMNDLHSVEPLIRLFMDPDWHIREKVVISLSNMGDIAVAHLKKVSKNALEDPRVRAFAQEVLLSIERSKSKVIPRLNRPGVIDIRLDAERQIALQSQSPLDEENERIAQQLVKLIQQVDEKGDYTPEINTEALEIGKFLSENGGNLRIHRIAVRVTTLGVSNWQLESWWSGICGWIA